MSSFNLIIDTLRYLDSPVLRHPEVQTKVNNFSLALNFIIIGVEYTHNSRVLIELYASQLVDRARFTLLVIVAEIINHESSTSSNIHFRTT